MSIKITTELSSVFEKWIKSPNIGKTMPNTLNIKPPVRMSVQRQHRSVFRYLSSTSIYKKKRNKKQTKWNRTFYVRLWRKHSNTQFQCRTQFDIYIYILLAAIWHFELCLFAAIKSHSRTEQLSFISVAFGTHKIIRGPMYTMCFILMWIMLVIKLKLCIAHAEI